MTNDQLNQDYLDEIAQYIIQNRGIRNQTIFNTSSSSSSTTSTKKMTEKTCILYLVID